MIARSQMQTHKQNIVYIYNYDLVTEMKEHILSATIADGDTESADVGVSLIWYDSVPSPLRRRRQNSLIMYDEMFWASVHLITDMLDHRIGINEYISAACWSPQMPMKIKTGRYSETYVSWRPECQINEKQILKANDRAGIWWVPVTIMSFPHYAMLYCSILILAQKQKFCH